MHKDHKHAMATPNARADLPRIEGVNREAEPTRTIGVGSGGFVRLRLNVCGKHWGSGGECCKCRAIAKDSPVAGALLAVYNATFYPPEI